MLPGVDHPDGGNDHNRRYQGSGGDGFAAQKPTQEHSNYGIDINIGSHPRWLDILQKIDVGRKPDDRSKNRKI